uniref:Uncharacterized protein n=1 Tax=Arundo donax TaxID=35708 RepID=A0A0A9A8P0_ARUDO
MAAACSAALRWRRAQSSLTKTKSTKKELTEKTITVVTMFMPMPPPPFESDGDDIAPASTPLRSPPAVPVRNPLVYLPRAHHSSPSRHHQG